MLVSAVPSIDRSSSCWEERKYPNTFAPPPPHSSHFCFRVFSSPPPSK
jgi:hypothetical protein